MKISVQTHAGKPITIMVDPSDTINVVMTKIQDQQRLIYGKKGLKGRRTLADCDIQDGSTLHLDL